MATPADVPVRKLRDSSPCARTASPSVPQPTAPLAPVPHCPTLPHTRSLAPTPRTASTPTRWAALAAAVCVGLTAAEAGAQSADATSSAPLVSGGPVRLRQPVSASAAPQARDASASQRAGDSYLSEQNVTPYGGRNIVPTPKYKPGEFETFVQSLVGATESRRGNGDPAGEGFGIRRFGSELMTPRNGSEASANTGDSALVPPDYVVGAGDELIVNLWGSVDADLKLPVDRTGRINIPRVGPIMVAGVRYADLPEVLRRRIGTVFKGFDLSVALGQLRGVRVYVTGFVNRPGAYHLNSLSTVAQALVKAGGPAAAGSFRQIQLKRAGQAPVPFDLYDLLLKGERAGDKLLQSDDVIHVPAAGAQVALIGSVNQPAIFEVKPGERVDDVLTMAGGFSPVADRSRVSVERLDERNGARVVQLALPLSNRAEVANGDVLRAFSLVEVTLSGQRQNKRVRVEGEVQRPGDYLLPATSTLQDAIAAAGGLSPSAYVFGTEFSRESVQATQQVNYDRALRDLETELTRSTSTQRTSTADDAAAQTARAASTSRLVEQLRAVRPTGRVVLQLPPDGKELPPLVVENGDRLYFPPRSTTVGVFGSVFNGGSYLHAEGRGVDDYLKLAGGPTRGADAGSTFVIRANGSVVSARQSSSWVSNGSLAGLKAEPGDTVFVPEEANKTTLVQNLKDWTQILSQFGLGLAAIKTLGN